MLKKISQFLCPILTYILLVQPIQGKDTNGIVLEAGLINCYPKDALDEVGHPLLGSPSTVVFDGQRLIFGNDKNPEDTFLSPVFTIDFPHLQINLQKSPLHYLTYPLFKNPLKYESATLTLNGKIVIMSGCFGTLQPSVSSQANCYHNHTLISFPVGHPEKVSVVAPFTTPEGTLCSLPVRKTMEKLLCTPAYPTGMPFINVEGLACIPGNRLVFGVRQIGENWSKNTNTILLMAVTYQIINEKVILFNDFEILYQINPHALLKTPAPLGLVALEYDKYNNQLLLLTTYEIDDHGTNDKIGTFLWTLSLDDLLAQKPPILVKTPEGKPLFFPHKLEGLTLVEKDTLFLVADDDHIFLHPDNTPYRHKNQAVYFIVKLSDSSTNSS